MSYSPIRWWSKWECEKQVLELWGDVATFLAENRDIAPKSREKLLQLITMCSNELQVELAINVDAGEPFVKATYTVEGDGRLALKYYDILSEVKASIQVHHWPNTAAIALRISNLHYSTEHWMRYASDCVKPGLITTPASLMEISCQPLICLKVHICSILSK